MPFRLLPQAKTNPSKSCDSLINGGFYRLCRLGNGGVERLQLIDGVVTLGILVRIHNVGVPKNLLGQGADIREGLADVFWAYP